MCMGPYTGREDNEDEHLESMKKFICQTSVACCIVYSTILGTLLCLFNTQTYTEHNWDNLYLNPGNTEDLKTLNILIASLIIAGVF